MYNNSIYYYPQNMYNQANKFQNKINYNTKVPYNDYRYGGEFLLPFALGFISSPLIFGATRPRPIYPPYPIQYPPNHYFPYY